MRRISPLLLALLLAATGVSEPDPVRPLAEPVGVVAADAPAPRALLRSAAPALSGVWQEGDGPGPRWAPRCSGPAAGPTAVASALASLDTACHARSDGSRGYAAADALARAGRPAVHSTPPPFRFV